MMPPVRNATKNPDICPPFSVRACPDIIPSKIVPRQKVSHLPRREGRFPHILAFLSIDDEI